LYKFNADFKSEAAKGGSSTFKDGISFFDEGQSPFFMIFRTTGVIQGNLKIIEHLRAQTIVLFGPVKG